MTEHSNLTVTHLSKKIRHPWTLRLIPLLDDLNLRLADGEIFGLIGPNGAGKTTTFKLLVGLLHPTTGKIDFRGRPLDQEGRSKIGFLPEQPYFYDHLTLTEILDFYGRLYGLGRGQRRQRVSALIERLHLGPKRKAALHTLSKGTLQRVGIAQAIINQPALLILDEPMSGLDPAGRLQMRNLIRSLQEDDGTTVIFSSHILSDAEMLCDRVGILAGGRLREIVELNRQTGARYYELSMGGMSDVTRATLARIAGQPPVNKAGQWSLRLPGPEAVRAALDAIHAGNETIERLVPVQTSLEDRFLAHVGYTSSLD